uniref:Uncharacterized protein n=1 Tax=Anguilla anguilla TaxID=7936 RepID=A0A0E9TMR2_ANGAN
MFRLDSSILPGRNNVNNPLILHGGL